jgi:hypothetical protein
MDPFMDLWQDEEQSSEAVDGNMRLNMKNPLWERSPAEAKEAFEAELRNRIRQIEKRLPFEERRGWRPGGVSYESVHLLGEMDILREMLGE